MPEKGSSALIKIAPIIFSLLVGGAAGYAAHYYSVTGVANTATGAPKTPGAPGAPGGAPGGPPGAGGGGGRGGGAGAQQTSSASLVRLVRNLGTIEKLQNKGLDAEQMKKALPILQQIKSADKLPEDDCKAKLSALEEILTADQKQALSDLTPARGGGGGGRGGAGGGGMAAMGGSGGGMPGGARPGSGGAPAGGRPSSGGMTPMGGGGGGMPGSGGAPADPDRPFAAERAKQSLDDLIGAVQNSGKH